MTKKIFTFGLLLSLLAVSNFSKALEQEYPRYGFWSNWSIGAAVDYTKQMNGNGWVMQRGTSIGASLFLEKELNYVWDLRLDLSIPGLLGRSIKNDIYADPSYRFDRYVFAGVGVKFSITDAIMGYDSNRRASIYLLGMAGVSYTKDEPVTAQLRDAVDTKFLLALTGGIGYSYKVCKHSTIFIELLADDHAAVPHFFDGKRRLTDFYAQLGYMYNFGPTKADRDLIAQRNMMTQDNYDALNSQINDLNNQLAEKDKQIKKLEQMLLLTVSVVRLSR